MWAWVGGRGAMWALQQAYVEERRASSSHRPELFAADAALTRQGVPSDGRTRRHVVAQKGSFMALAAFELQTDDTTVMRPLQSGCRLPGARPASRSSPGDGPAARAAWRAEIDYEVR